MLNERLFLRSNTRLVLATYTLLQAMILLCSPVSLAADYRLQSSSALMIENDDNVRLQANINEIESLEGTSAIFTADFSRNKANRSLRINNRLVSRQYDLNRYNSVDVSTTADYQHSFERGSLSCLLYTSDAADE